MSRKAKKTIDISAVDFKQNDSQINVKGKHGELSLTLDHNVKVSIEDNKLSVFSEPTTPYVGMYFALLSNMVHGVEHQFTETLLLSGVGYKAAFSNNQLDLSLGYSHPIKYDVPESISIEMVSPIEIKVKGCDKQLVGEVAAQIMSYRPAKKDPYKQKGLNDNMI